MFSFFYHFLFAMNILTKLGGNRCPLWSGVSLFSDACVAPMALSRHFKNRAPFNWSEPTRSWILLSKKKQSQVFHVLKCCIHVCILNRPCPRPSKAWVTGVRALQFRRLNPNASVVISLSYHRVPDLCWKYPAWSDFWKSPENPPTPASMRMCTASAPSVWSQNATQRSLPVSLLTQPSLQDPNSLTYWRATTQKYELNLEWPSKHWSSFPGVWVQRAILDTAPLNKEM